MVRSSNGSGYLSVYSDCLCSGWSEVRMVRDSSVGVVTVYAMDGQEFEWFGIALRV
jgi:hypothetical protein